MNLLYTKLFKRKGYLYASAIFVRNLYSGLKKYEYAIVPAIQLNSIYDFSMANPSYDSMPTVDITLMSDGDVYYKGNRTKIIFVHSDTKDESDIKRLLEILSECEFKGHKISIKNGYFA